MVSARERVEAMDTVSETYRGMIDAAIHSPMATPDVEDFSQEGRGKYDPSVSEAEPFARGVTSSRSRSE
jgi:hypothetical protein